jgi:subtilisin family serine protease
MLRRNIKPALAFVVLSMFAPLPLHAGGLPEICGDIGPDVVNLLNRYAAADAANFCVRAMTLAETRCFRQRDQVIQQANFISRRYNLAPVIPGCQPPVLLAAAPPPAYVPPPVLASGAREAVSHASLFGGWWWGLALLPLAGLGFIGGGGGGDDTTSTTATNIPDEFNAQYTLSIIGAKTAYQRGFTGKGVKVALIDTGMDTDNSEFAGRVVDSFNFTNNTAGNSNGANPHGTEVAGILAASRNFHGMHGVAYDANIMSLQVFDDNNQPLNSGGQLSTFAPAINYAVSHGAAVINGSYGPDKNWHDNSKFFGYQIIRNNDLLDGAAYLAAAQAGKILVFPAGDYYGLYPDVAANPTGPGFLPFISPSHNSITGVANGAYRAQGGGTVTADFSGMIGKTIVVVSTDRNNVISSFSNRCGVAAAWCMAAPGENIFTTAPNENYTTVTGTSFAAPQVAGAAAILKQEFPNLSADQIVNILLTTATDLGATGVDAIYGHGLLNLAKATAPIGSNGIALTNSVSGASVSLQSSSLSFSPAFGIAISDKLNTQDIAFLDSYERAYQMPLSNLVRVGNNGFQASDAVFSFGKDEDRTELDVSDSMKVSFTNETSTTNDKMTTGKPQEAGATNVDIKAFSLTSSLSKATTASVHYKDPNALTLGFSDSDRARMNRSINKSAMQNPYAAFATNDGYASIIETEAFGGNVKVAGFFGRENVMEGTNGDAGRNFGSQAELGYNLGGGNKLSFLGGALMENGGVLGSVGSGAFAFGEGTMTVYTGIGGSFNLGSKTTLRGAAYAGYTKPSLSDASLITGMSDLITSSFNIGVEHKDAMSKGDSLSFGIAQPIRVESGNMQFNVPYARDAESDTLYTSNLTQDFGKQGREIDFELNYSVPVEENKSSFSFGALYRKDAGHEAGNNDILGVVRYTNKF